MVQLESILAYIGAPVITALVGLILEYYLSIIPRLKKIKSILLKFKIQNRPVVCNNPFRIASN